MGLKCIAHANESFCVSAIRAISQFNIVFSERISQIFLVSVERGRKIKYMTPF